MHEKAGEEGVQNAPKKQNVIYGWPLTLYKDKTKISTNRSIDLFRKIITNLRQHIMPGHIMLLLGWVAILLVNSTD